VVELSFTTPLKNDGVRKSWDDELPNMMGKIIQMFQSTNQSRHIKYNSTTQGLPEIKWTSSPVNQRYCITPTTTIREKKGQVLSSSPMGCSVTW